MYKNLLIPLFLMLVMLCLPACSELDDTPSPQSSEPDIQDVVPEDQETQSDKEDEETVPVVNEGPETLADSEVRVVIDKFKQIEVIVKETNSKMTFSNEEITQPEVCGVRSISG